LTSLIRLLALPEVLADGGLADLEFVGDLSRRQALLVGQVDADLEVFVRSEGLLIGQSDVREHGFSHMVRQVDSFPWRHVFPLSMAWQQLRVTVVVDRLLSLR
jgi:hypothetical protein